MTKNNRSIILFVAGLTLGLLVGAIFFLISNSSSDEETTSSSSKTTGELISDEELPIITEEEDSRPKGTEENPFFDTPKEIKQEETNGVVYKFVDKKNYSPKQKVNVLAKIFGGENYKVKEERDGVTLYESGEGEELRAIVITDSSLGYWTYYQPDSDPILCITNGGEEPCPTDLGDAERKAKKLLQNFFPEENFVLNPYEGGGVYNIVVSPLIDGREASPPFVLEYSPEGQLLYATGYFAELEPQYDVEILNPKTVLENLNENTPWPVNLVEQTTIPTGQYASGDIVNRDSNDNRTVFVEEGLPGWKTYSVNQLGDIYLVPSYIFVPSGKNRAWNIIAVSEDELPNITN